MSVRELSQRMDFGLHSISERFGLLFMQWAIGLIYIWFGMLKFFPGLSPAEILAANTLDTLAMGLVSKDLLLRGLAIFEVLLGVLLITRIKSKLIIAALLMHMFGTFMPILIFPNEVFSAPPFGFTIVGQYIMKNFVIIGAALVLYPKR
ncbi:doxx family protein [Reichenbachiella ulvae]|uniref:Doxx family protein n=1 Tax=Reichenbachiella ulvae TaxID=2980104 RepID=A0ABT3CPJ4_9BACT|nr:doxx family protein [Reichenbachiella ulvae]MCV9385537.1 doxx family protein [Reichenbachiella ulvae]